MAVIQYKAFDPELGKMFSEARAKGKSMDECAALIGVDLLTVYHWMRITPHFKSDMIDASEVMYERLADELQTVHNDFEDVNRGRLKADVSRWILTKRLSAKYGDRLDVNVNQQLSITSALDEALKRSLPNNEKPQALDITVEVIDTPTDSKSERAASIDINEGVVPEPQSFEDLL